MDALKGSLATEEATTREQPAAKAKKRKKRAAGQREMLLLICGQRDREREARPAPRQRKAG